MEGWLAKVTTRRGTFDIMFNGMFDGRLAHKVMARRAEIGEDLCDGDLVRLAVLLHIWIEREEEQLVVPNQPAITT